MCYSGYETGNNLQHYLGQFKALTVTKKCTKKLNIQIDEESVVKHIKVCLPF